MFLPVALLLDTMSLFTYAGDRYVYHVGTLKSVDEGIKCFQEHLKKRNEILVGEPEMVSYLNYREELAHIIIYKSYSNLEYLEYLDEKKSK